ncbi:annulin-like [Planococcus citri]|uniref:annulin-like n=1 Tax=Planococcus citri TaxID=170843 RepID=UPI0031F77EEE
MSFLLHRAKEFSGPAPESVLKIAEVDYCLAENGDKHRTSSYDLMKRKNGEARLVIRRGQPFKVNLKLSRDYDATMDEIVSVFELQEVDKKRPIRAFVQVLQPGQVSERAWQAVIDDEDCVNDKSLKIIFTPGENIPIGKWLINIDTKRCDSKGFRRFTDHRPIYILFNPWCEEDLVYLKNESERQEYVLNDTGCIWQVPSDKVKPLGWSYSQFCDIILDCVLCMLDGLAAIDRKDPILVARHLAMIVRGIMEGRWGDCDEGGKPATYWMNSLDILEKYYKSKKPVKYAQCWVYAALEVTICRCLGLPCRAVTNFISGHDSNNSMTIDYIVDEKGRTIEMSEDYNGAIAVWNFHAWNEVWMKRVDLGSDYDGWQVLDGTYGYGPASVVAIKRGEIEKNYDCADIYAEVNADQVWWEYNKCSKTFKLLKKDINQVGQKISTKAIGKNTFEREDITLNYKYAESSPEERASVEKVLLQRELESDIARWYLNEFEPINVDLVFKLEPKNEVTIGKPFSIVLTVENRSHQKTYELTAILRVNTAMYTGHIIGEVKETEEDKIIKPNTTEKVKLDICWQDYGHKLSDLGTLQIMCFVPVKCTDFTYVQHENLNLLKPNIVIKLENEKDPLVVKKPVLATACFTNPLPVCLKNCKFVIEGSVNKKRIVVKLPCDVEVGGEVASSFPVIPESEGAMTIIVKFSCDELKGVDGFREFKVQAAKCSMETNYV